MGEHHFTYALYPHAGPFDPADITRYVHLLSMIKFCRQAYALNVPLVVREVDGPVSGPAQFFTVDQPSVILDTVKKAEDSNDIVVRLFECAGGRY
jgi:alpha-mannosidase